MKTEKENPKNAFYAECKQKIVEILRDERISGHAPRLCAAALNELAEDWVIYQVQALPAVDRGKLYGT